MKKLKKRCCEMCENCVPLGEGDFVCSENQDIVISDYEGTEDYFSCSGQCFSPLSEERRKTE